MRVRPIAVGILGGIRGGCRALEFLRRRRSAECHAGGRQPANQDIGSVYSGAAISPQRAARGDHRGGAGTVAGREIGIGETRVGAAADEASPPRGTSADQPAFLVSANLAAAAHPLVSPQVSRHRTALSYLARARGFLALRKSH